MEYLKGEGDLEKMAYLHELEDWYLRQLVYAASHYFDHEYSLTYAYTDRRQALREQMLNVIDTFDVHLDLVQPEIKKLYSGRPESLE